MFGRWKHTPRLSNICPNHYTKQVHHEKMGTQLQAKNQERALRNLSKQDTSANPVVYGSNSVTFSEFHTGNLSCSLFSVCSSSRVLSNFYRESSILARVRAVRKLEGRLSLLSSISIPIHRNSDRTPRFSDFEAPPWRRIRTRYYENLEWPRRSVINEAQTEPLWRD